MELVGSRSRNEHDEFSDWDYIIECEADFEQVQQQLSKAVIWNCSALPNLTVITLINRAGYLLDYTSNNSEFTSNWDHLRKQQNYPKIRDYWVITFKHLKALYRNYNVLCEVGLEISTSLARDIFFEYKLDLPNYRNDFYNFKQIESKLQGDAEYASTVTGLPYATSQEKIAKILALNKLVAQSLPDFATEVNYVFNDRLKLLGAD